MRNKFSFGIALLKPNVILHKSDLGGVLSEIYHRNPSQFLQNVECDASDSNENACEPWYVCMPTEHSDKYWFTVDTYSYFQINLKSLAIHLKSYKILSENKISGNAHLKNWAFYGSIDQKEWIPLHEMSNYEGLNGPSIIKEFKVNETQKFSYFRLYQTGPSCSDITPNRMAIQQLELIAKDYDCSFEYITYATGNIKFLILVLLEI